MTSASFFSSPLAEETVTSVNQAPEIEKSISERVDHALSTYYNQIVQPPDLRRDFLANIRGFQNNMSPHMYNNGALPLWAQVIADPNYYPVGSDEEIIRSHADRIREITRGAEVLIEQGIGDDHAILHKTLAMYDLIGAKHLALVDFSDAALIYGSLTVTQQRPELQKSITSLRKNFNTQSFNVPVPGKKVITQLGLTIGNNPDRDISSILKHYRNQMNDGDILIFSVDRNMDKLSLYRAYNKIFGIWVDNMRAHIATELPQCGFKPDDFRYMRIWDPETTSFHFGFKALRDGHVMDGDEKVFYEKGQVFWYLPSRRYRQATLDAYYNKAGGLELVDILTDSRNFVSWQVLKAVPRANGPA